MKKVLLLTMLGGCVLFVSCKKSFDCTCETDIYDSEGYYVGSYEEVHTVKARRSFGAAVECDNLSNYNAGKYCYMY